VFDFAVSVFGTLLQRIRGLNFGRAGSGKLKSETETAKKKESSQRTRKSKSKIFVLPRPLQVNSADCGTKKERLLCGDKISSIAGQLPTANFPIPTPKLIGPKFGHPPSNVPAKLLGPAQKQLAPRTAFSYLRNVV